MLEILIFILQGYYNHTGIANASGLAAIENAANHGALMILGRRILKRNIFVGIWDYLRVNGGMDVTGNVGIGTTDIKRTLHVEGSEIHSGGPVAGFSFANRNTRSFVESPSSGQRWVWYSDIDSLLAKTARLWSGKDLVTISVFGNVFAASFTPPSDASLKTNIMPLTDVLDKLEKIRGVSFKWNELDPYGRSEGGRAIGLIAQEVEEVFPELITASGDEGYRGIDYNRFTGVLLASSSKS